MNKKKKHPHKTSSGAVPFIVGVVSGCLFLCGVLISIPIFFAVLENSRYQKNREAYLSMFIDSDVMQRLCAQDAVPRIIADCHDASVNLQFRQVRQLAEYYVSQSMTYDEISSKIGYFEVMCHLPDQMPRLGTYRCAYEFDVGYTLRFVYDEISHLLLEIE